MDLSWDKYLELQELNRSDNLRNRPLIWHRSSVIKIIRHVIDNLYSESDIPYSQDSLPGSCLHTRSSDEDDDSIISDYNEDDYVEWDLYNWEA